MKEKPEPTFKCPKCKCEVKNYENLQFHYCGAPEEKGRQGQRSKLASDPLHSLKINKESKCPECNYSPKNYQCLRIHLQAVHHGIKYPCNKCEHSASTKGNLRKHIEIIHERKRYNCEKCSYSAPEMTSVKEHVEHVHEGGGFHCPHCKFSHAKKIMLKYHIKINMNQNLWPVLNVLLCSHSKGICESTNEIFIDQ